MLDKLLVGIRLISKQRHAEHGAADSHGFADAPQPGDAKRPAAQRQVGPPRPAAGAHGVVLHDNFFGQGQHQGEGMLGDGVLVRAGRDGDGDTVVGRRRAVHRVVAHARSSDDSELRVRRHDPPRVRLRTGHAGDDAFERGEYFLFRHLCRFGGISELEAGVTEQVEKGAVQTGERGRRYENFRHVSLVL